jgi:single-strand DNA-binding protein
MINKVILLGRLGKDPLIKHLDNGRVVANVTLATNDYYTKDGQRMESTEWHNLELWDNHAKMAEKYLRKGNILYVEGKIRTDKYTDSEGIEKQIKKIRVLQMQMMGGMNRQENEDGFSERSNGSSSEGYEQEQKSYNNSDDYRHEPNDPKEDELPF